ncbi:S1 RNA-binding domain-containing protein [Streptomyces sp. H27-H1]|uniref:S1 RNA-binding domain-containing protein n=1 Tax=Streptomyces sp. H27-H1 TaxID=2996461 RepID=UPI00226E0074|nr:S1 RNA-binding domain-containing protein [Streptomyces sp. H27-H1]MCY0931870.1 S1 RNA-binding domain-containing protein [Streptomyces sp. H27-H1]
MTEPHSSEALTNFLNTLQVGEVRTGRVISLEGREVLVELDGFSGPGKAVGRIPRGDLTRKAIGHPAEAASIGQQIAFEVISVDWQKECVWASASACEDPALRAFLLGLQRGARHQGQVQSVHNFGVFVNLDGEPNDQCTGFIRGPELSWLRIDHPADAVAAGQRVVGEIIDVDTRRGQVQLSLKALQENPLVPFVDQAGLVTTGQVTKLIPFGAFVRIADGVEGLVHNTEFRDEPVEHPGQIVSEGDEITVRIVEVDLTRHRLTLSARNLSPEGKRPF